MNSKIKAAMASLQAQGHTVRSHPHMGEEWFEIDQCMLARPNEMEELADGVYTLDELEELFTKRRLEEQGRL
jgi:hypothetical protein